MRDSFTVFTDEGMDLPEAAALLIALRRCTAKGLTLADEPELKVGPVTIFSGEGYEEDIPRNLSGLDAWSVEITLAPQHSARR